MFKSVFFLQSSLLECDDGWLPAGRYWSGNEPEWDIVSWNLDGRLCLLGEAKWCDRSLRAAEYQGLLAALRARQLPPPAQGKEVCHALFVTEAVAGAPVLTAGEVLQALMR